MWGVIAVAFRDILNKALSRETPHGSVSLHLDTVPELEIEISGEALDALAHTAQVEGLTLDQVISKAISLQIFLSDQSARGAKVVLEHRDDSRELVAV